MPVQFTIDVDRKLVVSTYSGEISESDFFEVASRIKAHPDFNPSFSELVDFSGATGVSISTSALQSKARQESIYTPSSMHVVIVPPPYLYGLAPDVSGVRGADQTKCRACAEYEGGQ